MNKFIDGYFLGLTIGFVMGLPLGVVALMWAIQ